MVDTYLRLLNETYHTSTPHVQKLKQKSEINIFSDEEHMNSPQRVLGGSRCLKASFARSFKGRNFPNGAAEHQEIPSREEAGMAGTHKKCEVRQAAAHASSCHQEDLPSLIWRLPLGGGSGWEELRRARLSASNPSVESRRQKAPSIGEAPLKAEGYGHSCRNHRKATSAPLFSQVFSGRNF